MGVINAENMLQFKSSDFLIARIKKRLHSFDADNLVDEGDFPKLIADSYDELGMGVHKECQALLTVVNGKVKLPDNFKQFYALYAVDTRFASGRDNPVAQGKPWIFYTKTEVSEECVSKCQEITEDCKTKIVIEKFVNDGPAVSCKMSNPVLLRLSPNVKKSMCDEESISLFCTAPNEVTVDDDRYIHTQFDSGHIYLQYYGLPMDENDLIKIPDNTWVEKAIEYYIYVQLFEEFYWNSTVPDISGKLQDARNQYDNKYLPQARYWVRLPSFQKMVQSIRRSRKQKKFYYSKDRTIVR